MNKLNYKFINTLVLLAIITLILYISKNYLFVLNEVLTPIVLSFFISYSFYPIVKYLNKKISYNLSCFIVLSIVSLILILSFYFLYQNIKVEYLSLKDEINYYLNTLFKTNYSFHLIKNSYSFVTNIIFIIVLTIYFTFNMDRIRKFFSKYKIYKIIDKSLLDFYKSFYFIIFLEALIYLVLFYIIGHPKYLFISFLSILNFLLPFIGQIILVTFVILKTRLLGYKLFILTSILLMIIPIFNNYFLEVKIYKNNLNINFIEVFLSCFIFGFLFNLTGIVLSIPLYITLKNIYFSFH